MNPHLPAFMQSSPARHLARWHAEKDGTQLLEYGLLAGAIGLAGLLVFSTFSARMADSYTDWNSETQDIWEPCPPQPAVCP
jgi:Flp pilus assembly pilin Flp